MATKLWVDDIRSPPDMYTWCWAHTADGAIKTLEVGLLMGRPIVELSLDHDLGLLDLQQAALATSEDEQDERTGYDVILWMEANLVWPPVVHLHTQNPVGRANMARALQAHGYERHSVSPAYGHTFTREDQTAAG